MSLTYEVPKYEETGEDGSIIAVEPGYLADNDTVASAVRDNRLAVKTKVLSMSGDTITVTVPDPPQIWENGALVLWTVPPGWTEVQDA